MRYRLYLFDLDGTLFRGAEAIPGAPEAVARVRGSGAQVRFLTNNSGARAECLAKKLTGLGIAAHRDEVVTSGIASARHLMEHGVSSAFAVGEEGLILALIEHGMRVVNSSDSRISATQSTEQAQAVVVGICRHFSYELLDAAMQQIMGGARFVATNPDTTYPHEGGLKPGAGALVAAVRACTGVDPFVAGKPQPTMAETAMREAGAAPSETLLVGDRLDTDIACGKAAGCDTWLVLTGVERESPEGQPFSPDLTGLP